MDDAAIVGRLQTVGKLSGNPNDLLERQWTFREAFGQRQTIDELEDERRDVTALLYSIDGADVGMIQRGERPRLLLETGASLGVVGDEVGEDFDGDLTPELRVVRTVHLTHSAGTEQGLDTERPQLAAGRESVRGSWRWE